MTQQILTRVPAFEPTEVYASEAQTPETTKLMVFQLQQHWFCLPLAQVRRVVAKSDPAIASASVIQLEHETIPLVDAASLVYGDLTQLPDHLEQPDCLPPLLTSVQSILIVDLPSGASVGLIVDGTPLIKRVPPTAVSPIPLMYLTIHHLQNISHMVTLVGCLPSAACHLFMLTVEGIGDR